MKRWRLVLSLFAALSVVIPTCLAQQPTPEAALAATTSVVPQLVNYSGVLTDADGKPITSITAVRFLLSRDQQGGTALWLETQNVHPDRDGHYSVVLGSATSEGLPRDVFTSGEARWLGVEIAGQEEQPRVLLVAVPYALKAGDAETVGGLPASAFALANGTKAAGTTTPSSSNAPTLATNSSRPANANVTGKGGVDFIPMWDSASDIIDSLIFQKSSNVGINTTAPAATLDVNGKGNVRDTLTLFPKGTDSALAVNGTAFKIDQTGKVTFASGQTFPGTGTLTGITTATGSGLSGGGTKGTLSLALTKTCTAKQVLQWNGSTWACSAAGTGTITGVTTASASGLTGGGTSGSLNLSINPTVVPELGAANKFTNTNSISVDGSGPALTLANPNGDGLDVSSAGGDGIFVAAATSDGIAAIGSNAGGFFSGPGFGSYSVANTDGKFATGVYGGGFGSTQETLGVTGFSASPRGIGTYGQAVSASAVGPNVAGVFPVGVWGDSGASLGVGVYGSSDSSNAIFGLTNGSANTAFFENLSSNSPQDAVLGTFGLSFGGQCEIDVSGSLSCTGSKSAVVPVDGGARKVSLYAVESPENWFEDAGFGQLSNGSAVISLEPTFSQTVNTEMEYHVFLTPKGDCEGLYVSNETATGFEVHELRHGRSSIGFDYRIMARRKGYENIRLADRTKQFAPHPKPVVSPGRPMPTAQEILKAQEAHVHATR